MNVVSGVADSRVLDIIEEKHVVHGRTGVERLLEESVMTGTFDLIGHSVNDLLQLGDWLIDSSAVPWFQVHASLLRRFQAVRLLGCHTAVSPEARRTICAIADALGIEVWGTTGFVFHYHYRTSGFDPAWQFLLKSASDLRYGEETQRSPISKLRVRDAR